MENDFSFIFKQCIYTNRQPKSSRSFCISKLYSCQVSILCGLGGIKGDRRWGRGWWRGDYSAFCFWVTTPSSLPLLLACFETFFNFFTFFITFLFLHFYIHLFIIPSRAPHSPWNSFLFPSSFSPSISIHRSLITILLWVPWSNSLNYCHGELVYYDQ